MGRIKELLEDRWEPLTAEEINQLEIDYEWEQNQQDTMGKD